MWIPNPIPAGTWCTYVFAERDRPYFKIGLSRKPQSRRKQVSSRKLRPRHYRAWEFDSYFAALYVEQAIIGLLKDFEFQRVSSDDWFEVDEPTMKVVTEIADDLATKIRYWEFSNVGMFCVPLGRGSWGREHFEPRKRAS
jgi:hypothetical protein